MHSQNYVKPTPKSTIHPWNEDVRFQEVYARIRGHTLVDQYRLHELWSIVQQVLSLEGDLLEVGVWRGGSAAIILHAMNQGDREKTLYAADTFSGVVHAGEHDPVYVGGEHADCSEEQVHALLSQQKTKNCVKWKLLRGIFPEKCAISIQNDIFCFCHIDVDVYTSAREITRWVWPRLVANGVLIFDDYGFENCGGVRRWVDEFCASMKGAALLVYNVNGHALVVKR